MTKEMECLPKKFYVNRLFTDQERRPTKKKIELKNVEYTF